MNLFYPDERKYSANYPSLLPMEYFHTWLEILVEHSCTTIYYMFVSSVDGVLPYLAENLKE